MQIKPILTRKVLHSEPHFESESFWNLEVAYSISQTENLHQLVLIVAVLNIISSSSISERLKIFVKVIFWHFICTTTQTALVRKVKIHLCL